MIMRVLLLLAGLIALIVAPQRSLAQASGVPPQDEAQTPTNSSSAPPPANAPDAAKAPPNPNLEDTIEAGESDAEPKRQLVRWNQYEGPYFTIRAGGGFLFETGAYAQDDQSKEQFVLTPEQKIRDVRVLLSGKFPSFERAITWCAGLMYDAPTHTWFVRQTGIMVAVPELWGHIFIGRAKEGFSLNKVMTGYDGWTMERSTMNDASIPLLADGIKWLGNSPKNRFLWNLGYFNDLMSKGQSFSSYSSQEVARFIWLPIRSESKDRLLHLGVNLRYGKPVDDKLRLKSRPEAFPAPYFLDTGTFDAKSTTMAGYEVYYRPGSWLFGSEYWFEKVSSPSKGDLLFHGGDIAATWLVTGETRPYNMVGGYFKSVSPARPVFEGGPGAWELVLRYSYTDLDSRTVQGGKFGRITPMVNWYLSDHVRMEFAYGYGHLDRFDLKGNTQFFQTRLQLQL